MDNVSNVRNISVIAHVNHGKSTLIDTLVWMAERILQDDASEDRYTDIPHDEQDLDTTLKSTANPLYCEMSIYDLEDVNQKTHGIYFAPEYRAIERECAYYHH